MVKILAWSRVYLRSNLSNNLLQKVLTLVLLTETGTEFFVATMNSLLYDSYDALEETLTPMKSLKRKKSRGERYRFLCINLGRC